MCAQLDLPRPLSSRGAFSGETIVRVRHIAGNTHLISAISLVVPCRNEVDNIRPLIERLDQALPDTPLEIIFVDDSDDETPAAIEASAAYARSNVRLIHRPRGQRHGGLGGAVVAGMRAAQGAWVAVMDADLQHPPEVLPQLYAEAQGGTSDVVIASRYCERGSAGGLNRFRELISHGSSNAAYIAFPRRLRSVSDPMSGFFMVRRDAIDVDLLQPKGFKILLEILTRGKPLRTAEVGYEFAERHAGTSKASLREGLRFLAHLLDLRLGAGTMRFMGFLLVGISGLLVNSLALAALTELFHLFYLVSAVLATQVSTLWNFALSEFLVFGGERSAKGRLSRLVLFALMNNLALGLRGPMIYGLTAYLGLHYLISNFLSLVLLTVLRFGVADRWIWGTKPVAKEQSVRYSYNIHGVISVSSEVDLPELKSFKTAEPIERPMIVVRLGDVNGPQRRRLLSTLRSTRHIHYDDGLGPFGFAMDVILGDTIDVLVSPMLRRSPHVLYTNVVEPILRWTFVEKGYALVHGACVSFHDKAFLVTARTDTGKTTTILRLLDRQRRASDTGSFLSDDLTLVAPDGQVLTYPKPMTISAHTVAAVNTPVLHWRERLTLPFQSRIHSRGGRRFAFLLTQTRLPVASINTLVQWIVPPPKYPVQRLVPTARMVEKAQLAGMIIIERGEDRHMQLDSEEGLAILMRNCDDAYGFPPYESIRSTLQQSPIGDLREREEELVGSVLRNLPVVLIGSSKMDWSQRIPAIVNQTLGRDVWSPREPVHPLRPEELNVTLNAA